jgi:hypothetical protein
MAFKTSEQHSNEDLARIERHAGIVQQLIVDFSEFLLATESAPGSVADIVYLANTNNAEFVTNLLSHLQEPENMKNPRCIYMIKLILLLSPHGVEYEILLAIKNTLENKLDRTCHYIDDYNVLTALRICWLVLALSGERIGNATCEASIRLFYSLVNDSDTPCRIRYQGYLILQSIGLCKSSEMKSHKLETRNITRTLLALRDVEGLANLVRGDHEDCNPAPLRRQRTRSIDVDAKPATWLDRITILEGCLPQLLHGNLDFNEFKLQLQTALDFEKSEML